MIPYLLAAIGGYLLGDSMKDSEKFADGGGVNPKNIKVGDVVKLTTIGPKGKVVEIIESPAPFVSRAKIDWEDKKDRGFMYVTHIQKFDKGGVAYAGSIIGKEVTDTKSEIESIIGNYLTLELEVEFYIQEIDDYIEKEYEIEIYYDYDGYSINKINSEDGKQISKEEREFLENEKSISSEIDRAYDRAMQQVADEEKIDEYDDDYYAYGGEVKSNSGDIQVGDMVMVNAEVARNEGNMFTALKDIKGIVTQKSGSVYVVHKVDKKGNAITGNKGLIGTFGVGVTKI